MLLSHLIVCALLTRQYCRIWKGCVAMNSRWYKIIELGQLLACFPPMEALEFLVQRAFT